MTKGTTTLIRKGPQKETTPKLQALNVPTDDVENTNDTYLGRELLFA